MGDVFNARDLWASQVPYFEADRVEPRIVTALRTMLHACRWTVQSDLTADATVVLAE